MQTGPIEKKTKLRKAVTALFLMPLLFMSCDTGSGVVLREEYLDILVRGDRSVTVNVKFIFTGTENYTGTLAFPKSVWFPMRGFTAAWNGRVMPPETVSAPEGEFFSIGKETCTSLYTFRVPPGSPNRSVHTISYTYTMPYVDFSKEYEAKGHYLEYILRTGALWRGRVSKLKVSVVTESARDCRKILILDNSFKGKCTGGNRWTFEGEDIELNRNIRLLLR